jgi:carbamoyl-phosphate synthase large subunit
MPLRDLKVVLTACGAPGAPGIIKSLRKNGERAVSIVGTDMNPEAVGFALVDGHRVVPSGSDPRFIGAMVRLCEEEKPDAIVPLATYELGPFSKNLHKFSSLKVSMAISPFESLEIANNKARLYEFFSRKKVPVPGFTVVRDATSLENAAKRLGYPNEPVCFKPAVSKGSRGFRVVIDDSDRTSKFFETKPDSTETDLDGLVSALSANREFPESLVMEYLPGKEYSVDLLADRGDTLICIPRFRKETRQGISFRAVTEKNEKVIEASRKIVKGLSLHGNIGIQMRESADGVPKLLEINPRLQGSVVLCTAAGVNLPYLGLKLAMGEKLALPEVRWGVGMSRHWEEVFYDESGRPYSL